MSTGSTLEADLKLFDACLALAGFSVGRFDARRNYEWKLSFGIWALLAAATAIGFEKLPGLIVLVPLLHGRWLQGLWVRFAMDAATFWNYFNEAERIVAGHGIKTVPPPKHLRVGDKGRPGWWKRYAGFLDDWSLGLQFLITLALTGCAAAVASHLTLYELALKPSH